MSRHSQYDHAPRGPRSEVVPVRSPESQSLIGEVARGLVDRLTRRSVILATIAEAVIMTNNPELFSGAGPLVMAQLGVIIYGLVDLLTTPIIRALRSPEKRSENPSGELIFGALTMAFISAVFFTGDAPLMESVVRGGQGLLEGAGHGLSQLGSHFQSEAAPVVAQTVQTVPEIIQPAAPAGPDFGQQVAAFLESPSFTGETHGQMIATLGGASAAALLVHRTIRPSIMAAAQTATELLNTGVARIGRSLVAATASPEERERARILGLIEPQEQQKISTTAIRPSRGLTPVEHSARPRRRPAAVRPVPGNNGQRPPLPSGPHH